MSSEKFVITLCNPNDHNQEYPMVFELWDNNLTTRWKQKVLQAQSAGHKIDDPHRFYGLMELEKEKQLALDKINSCIDTINSDVPLIDRRLHYIQDTDTLNYLHHIFEEYHGLLDTQNTQFWNSIKPATQKALADLNILVHRAENVLYGNKPRFTVTYFGLPKTSYLEPDDYKFLTNFYIFGGLYLNYVEIGKTLEDLVRDNDQYIEPAAFQPWKRYSADFTVKLFDIDTVQGKSHSVDCLNYFNQHREFFKSIGYDSYMPCLRPGSISIGQLKYTDKKQVLEQIRKHSCIKTVEFKFF